MRTERLKFAAEVLVLRHDTLKLIDGTGKDTGSQDQNKAEPAPMHGKEPERQKPSQKANKPKRPNCTKR